MWKSIGLVASVLLLASCSDGSVAENYKDSKSSQEKVKAQQEAIPLVDSHVQVIGAKEIGEGIIVKSTKKYQYILTNASVVAANGDALVKFKPNHLVKAEVYRLSDTENLAIVKVKYAAETILDEKDFALLNADVHDEELALLLADSMTALERFEARQQFLSLMPTERDKEVEKVITTYGEDIFLHDEDAYVAFIEQFQSLLETAVAENNPEILYPLIGAVDLRKGMDEFVEHFTKQEATIKFLKNEVKEIVPTTYNTIIQTKAKYSIQENSLTDKMKEYKVNIQYELFLDKEQYKLIRFVVNE